MRLHGTSLILRERRCRWRDGENCQKLAFSGVRLACRRLRAFGHRRNGFVAATIRQVIIGAGLMGQTPLLVLPFG